jgi:hypothetical protein
VVRYSLRGTSRGNPQRTKLIMPLLHTCKWKSVVPGDLIVQVWVILSECVEWGATPVCMCLASVEKVDSLEVSLNFNTSAVFDLYVSGEAHYIEQNVYDLSQAVTYDFNYLSGSPPLALKMHGTLPSKITPSFLQRLFSGFAPYYDMLYREGQDCFEEEEDYDESDISGY